MTVAKRSSCSARSEVVYDVEVFNRIRYDWLLFYSIVFDWSKRYRQDLKLAHVNSIARVSVASDHYELVELHFVIHFYYFLVLLQTLNFPIFYCSLQYIVWKCIEWTSFYKKNMNEYLSHLVSTLKEPTCSPWCLSFL